MFKKMSFIAILLGTFTLADCTEIGSDSQTLSRLTALGAILENQDSSSIDLSLQRVYLNPEKITITNHGVVYVTDEKTVVLPELFSSNNGCFISCSYKDLETLSQNDEIRIWWCDSCKAFRSMDKYGHCKSCGRKL